MTQTFSEKYFSDSVEKTVEIARDFAQKHLAAGHCVALDGQLGAGKTQFARGLAGGMGLDNTSMVSSPTFVLMQEYPAEKCPVYHLDAYRLTQPDAELADMGFDEMLTDGLVVLEWATKAEKALPVGCWYVQIDSIDENTRQITISGGK